MIRLIPLTRREAPKADNESPQPNLGRHYQLTTDDCQLKTALRQLTTDDCQLTTLSDDCLAYRNPLYPGATLQWG